MDAPATTADPTADINDVYTFLDGTSVVFAMTTHPAAAADSKFSDAVQYVFHTSSGAFGATTADYNIICQFSADAKPIASCWGGNDEYATGDASSATGISSADGKMKIFAGLRADPFFFNLDGFKKTVSIVDGAEAVLAAGGAFNDAGCPTLDPSTSSALVTQLKTSPDGGAPQDFFKTLNGLAIVVKIDSSLVTKGGKVASVWASTHKKP